MKLMRAQFQNFRLLRDLEVTFSTDPIRKLTVIRAANETGKTTILTALQWSLYGNSALPGRGEDYRLHPIDWDTAVTRRVPITATVDFQVTAYRRGPTGIKETRRQYRIVRSAYEELDGHNWRRFPSTVLLFGLTERGADPIDAPKFFINDELPPELREVFFTDGDRALSFIEADVALSTKRDRVQRAIRSLLGLGVIEEALRHVQRTASDINKQAKQVGGGSELSTIASRIEANDSAISKLHAEAADAEQQFTSFDEQLVDIDRKIGAALQKGDRDKLKHDLEQAKREIQRLDERVAAAEKDHSQLFRGQSLARDLLGPVLTDAFKRLEELRDRGKIPNATIPVLEDRLNAGTCICGESLSGDDTDDSRRRQHIQHLIDSSRRADEVQGIVTELYFGSKSLRPDPGEADGHWIDEYRKIVENRDGLQELREEAGRKLKAIELQIDSLPDTDIQGLRDTRRQFLQQRDRFLAKKTQLDTQLKNLQDEQRGHEETRERLLREQKKGARILAELEVTQDIRQILERSYKRITDEELLKVSGLMNSIFLEMIGADPDQGAIIQRSEISREFDIIVYGPNQRTLNPDRDLNGASRRALTLAFILALTKVSEVEAPNVIDTPLGMMSGYVKRSVLRQAIEQSSQLVLFLTPSEIEGCEELLDKAAGSVITLTNPAHYPRMLAYDPGVSERKVLRCDCNHRQTCHLCERKAEAAAVLDLAS